MPLCRHNTVYYHNLLSRLTWTWPGSVTNAKPGLQPTHTSNPFTLVTRGGPSRDCPWIQLSSNAAAFSISTSQLRIRWFWSVHFCERGKKKKKKKKARRIFPLLASFVCQSLTMFAQRHSRVIFELGLESRRKCPILCEIDDHLGEQGSISYYFFQIILNLGFSGWSFNRFIVANWSRVAAK